MSKVKYLISRTIISIALVLIVMSGLFFFFRLLPGDYTSQMIYQGASPETIAHFTEQWGLDQPIHVQYIRYMENMLALDPGVSVRYRRPVLQLVRMKIFNSAILIAPAITVAYILGSFVGVYAGVNRGSWFERYGIISILAFGATPSFVLAVFAVAIFSLALGWFPTGSMVPPEYYSLKPWWRPYLTFEFVKHYTLPFIVIVLRYLLVPSLIMRTSVVEVMGQEFINYQRITGLSLARRWFHIAKHSSLPVITLYPISMTRALGGMVLVEIVFNWPGIGNFLVESVFVRDTPVVQFIFVLMAIYIIFANFLVDIIYGFIDPRVSVGD